LTCIIENIDKRNTKKEKVQEPEKTERAQFSIASSWYYFRFGFTLLSLNSELPDLGVTTILKKEEK
jgi:hypothetical protein